MVEIPMEVADIDEMAVLDEKSATRATRWHVKVCRNSSKRIYTIEMVSATETPETAYLKYTECHSRGVGSVEATVKNSSVDTDESNTLLDVPIVIPERAEGLSESKETKETAEVKSNGRQSGIGVRPYYIDEGN